MRPETNISEPLTAPLTVAPFTATKPFESAVQITVAVVAVVADAVPLELELVVEVEHEEPLEPVLGLQVDWAFASASLWASCSLRRRSAWVLASACLCISLSSSSLLCCSLFALAIPASEVSFTVMRKTNF